MQLRDFWRCPQCNGWLLDVSPGMRFCPAEDPHKGGLLLTVDGAIVGPRQG